MNKKGVTLIALTIIILVLVILVGTSIYFGFRALYKTNNFNIYTNLSLVAIKLEEYYDNYTFNPVENNLPGSLLTVEMRVLMQNNGVTSNLDKWLFLTSEDIKNMKLPAKIKDPNTNLMVNYEDKDIFYTKGYRKNDGEFIYLYSLMKEAENNN